MGRAAERARVQAMVDDLLATLRAMEAKPWHDREARLALARAADRRHLARHGRPLAHWFERWQRERDEQDELLAQLSRNEA